MRCRFREDLLLVVMESHHGESSQADRRTPGGRFPAGGCLSRRRPAVGVKLTRMHKRKPSVMRQSDSEARKCVPDQSCGLFVGAPSTQIRQHGNTPENPSPLPPPVKLSDILSLFHRANACPLLGLRTLSRLKP